MKHPNTYIGVQRTNKQLCQFWGDTDFKPICHMGRGGGLVSPFRPARQTPFAGSSRNFLTLSTTLLELRIMSYMYSFRLIIANRNGVLHIQVRSHKNA